MSATDDEIARLEATVATLQAQTALLGAETVDVAVAPLQARLSLLRDATQSLRQVSILFLDVVGSTTLSQRLDPEEIHTLMDGILAPCTRIVVHHGGKVLQYAGDSLLAVFGLDLAREDDAERSVRAGLALLDEGRRQGVRVLHERGHAGFNVRVGVHTGSVLLGGGVEGDGGIHGIAVNIAARMEQTAPPGTLRISRDTYRQVRSLFDAIEQEPLAVKGIDQPMTTYLVERPRPQAIRGSGRGLGGQARAGRDKNPDDGAPIVGRDDELAALSRVVAEARAVRALRMTTVIADAGVGKSRLLRELDRRLERNAAVRLFHGRAQRHGVNMPHGVVRSLLTWHCGILDSDSPAAACSKLTASFGAVFEARAAEQSALVGSLIGLDFSASPHIAGIVRDGRQIQARAFHALAQFIASQCTDDDSLVVLLLDDLHWADDGSLDFIDYLTTSARRLPVVVGCFGRPPLLERRPAWGIDAASSAWSSRLVLQPLGTESSARLIDTLLPGHDATPAVLRAMVLEHADGNPFHIEELVGMLIDDGVVFATDTGWRVDPGRLARARVPSTLTAVLQARLDALRPDARVALQKESVIGHVFWDEALREIAPESMPALGHLEERELIERRDESTFAGIGEYAFKHHLLHQVTYDTVLRRSKRALHGRTADWLVKNTGERIGEHFGLIADHYERAGDDVRSVLYLQRAADAAYASAVYGSALAYVDRALALLPPDAVRTRFDLLQLRMNIDNATGRRDEVAADLERASACVVLLDDGSGLARLARWRSLLAVVTGDYLGAIEAADRAHDLAVLHDDRESVLGALLDKGQALIYLGDRIEAERCLRATLPLAEASVRPDLACLAINRLNAIAQDRGDYAAARDHLQAALALARQSGNRRFEGALIGNLGRLESRLGHHGLARELLQAGLSVSRDIGDRGSVPYGQSGLAAVAYEEGDVASALSLAVEARDVARAVADRGCEAECVMLIGLCRVALDDGPGATAAFDEHDAWSRQGAALNAVPPIAARAELALADGRIDDAMDVVAELLAWLDRDRATEDPADCERHFACHRVLRARGDRRSERSLERAHALLMRTAALLDDADRKSWFALRLHRAVAAAWASRNDAG